ncbi:MAG: 5-formyltetrahydrofolate cyclo-ligase [Verrucomicrobiae bacterium]|nr:5-formyltetrahydrofolate cyclo-ligase [Verrucomicrobiae bacterium]
MKVLSDQKKNLREAMLAALAALSPGEVRRRSEAVCRRALAVRDLATARWVMGFVSFGTEVHTHELLRALLAEGRRVCVPSFDPVGQRYLCSELKHFDSDLTEGKLGILEPRHGAVRPVPSQRIEAWLVPGLAFDLRGNRLGRGMGYFDRLLCDAGGVKIGLGYDFQLLEEVPTEQHDARLDFVVTETQTIHCNPKHP